MTTAAATTRPGLIATFQQRRLGPLVFVAILAILDLLLIGPTQFINGLTSGAIYALIALGYTMVYGIIELINFAHGDVFMVGVFASIFVLTALNGIPGWFRVDGDRTADDIADELANMILDGLGGPS